jgi:V/A-type H+-transporting ATPase subunit K
MYLLIIFPIIFLFLSIFVSKKTVRRGTSPKKAILRQVISCAFVCLCCFAMPVIAHAASGTTASHAAEAAASGNGLGLLAAGLAMGLGGIGGGIAVASSVPAAIGATSENPKAFGKAMVLVAMGEGIAFFSLAVALLIILLKT